MKKLDLVLVLLSLSFSLNSFAAYVIYQHPIQVTNPYATTLYDGKTDRLGKKELISFLRYDDNVLTIRTEGGYEIKKTFFTESAAQSTFAALKSPDNKLSLDVSDCEEKTEFFPQDNQGGYSRSPYHYYQLSYNQCSRLDTVKLVPSQSVQKESKYSTVNFKESGSTLREFSERMSGRP